MALLDALKSLVSGFLLAARERLPEPLDDEFDRKSDASDPSDESTLSAREREARAYREAQYISPGGWC